MRVMVIGNGAREHALAWKLSDCPSVDEVFIAPGNGGTGSVGTNLAVSSSDVSGLIDAAKRHQIDLTVVGPEAPLADGIVDEFEKHGLVVAGPNQEAAQIESSKVWAKEIMNAAGVPTGRSMLFRDHQTAVNALDSQTFPLVIKANGLAAGKGVTITSTRDEAEVAVQRMMVDRTLGDAANEVLFEEFLSGQEVSLLVLTDGTTAYPLLAACDYKRACDDEQGPNTGGMGAYAPAPVVDQSLLSEIMSSIIHPTLNELQRRGIRYQGVLYAGLILTADGPKVIEYNCRFGDPETEVLLPLLKSDLGTLLLASATGTLADVSEPEWHDGACVTVVIASGGYPGSYQTGVPINGLATAVERGLVFHAGTKTDQTGVVRSSGGRVLAVTGCGTTLVDARNQAYEAVEQIHFDDAHYRRDIASREIE